MLNRNLFLSRFPHLKKNASAHVCSSDGHKVGRVVSFNEDSFLIERGHFFHKETVARYDDIEDCRGDILVLTYDRETLEKWRDESYSGWVS
jgi:hypothetical protein